MTTHDPAPTAASAPSAGPLTLRSDMPDVDAGDAAHGGVANGDSAQVALIDVGLSADYRARWTVVQGDFIDAPRTAVTNADALVGEVLAHVADTFAQQRTALEQGWADDASDTEELRIALRRYRAFFHHLLTL